MILLAYVFKAFLFLITMMLSTNKIKVMGVNTYLSMFVSANKLPIVFNKNKTIISQNKALINLGDFIFFIYSALINTVIKNKILVKIEAISKLNISSIYFNLPPQTIVYGST